MKKSFLNGDGKLCLYALDYPGDVVSELGKQGIKNAEDLFALNLFPSQLSTRSKNTVSKHTYALEKQKVYLEIPIEILKTIVIAKETTSGGDTTFGHAFIFGRNYYLYLVCQEFNAYTLGALADVDDEKIYQSIPDIRRLGPSTIVQLFDRLVELGLREDNETILQVRQDLVLTSTNERIVPGAKPIIQELDFSNAARDKLWENCVCKMYQLLGIPLWALKTKYAFSDEDIQSIKEYRVKHRLPVEE